MGSFDQEPKSKNHNSSTMDMSFELENTKSLIKSFSKDNGVDKKFTTNEASMAITSCIMGAGIVSVPYGMTENGIWLGIACHLALAFCMLFCSYMYMVARDLFMIKSYSDLCYMTFGKKGIYLANAMPAFILMIVSVLYLELFSSICISLFSSTNSTNWFQVHILRNKLFWILFTAALESPLLLRRRINALKCSSYILIIAIMLLFLTFVILNF